MDDLIERLRSQVPYQGKSNIAFLCHEAADRITSLQQALERIAMHDPSTPGLHYDTEANLIASMVAIARAALRGEG